MPLYQIVDDHSIRIRFPWTVATPDGVAIARFECADDAGLFIKAASDRAAAPPPGTETPAAPLIDASDIELIRSAAVVLGGFARGFLARQLAELAKKVS